MYGHEKVCEAYHPGPGSACWRCGWSAVTHKAAVAFDWQPGSFAMFAPEVAVPVSQELLLWLARRPGQTGPISTSTDVRPPIDSQQWFATSLPPVSAENRREMLQEEET